MIPSLACSLFPVSLQAERTNSRQRNLRKLRLITETVTFRKPGILRLGQYARIYTTPVNVNWSAQFFKHRLLRRFISFSDRFAVDKSENVGKTKYADHFYL